VGVQKRLSHDCPLKQIRAPLIDDAVLSIVRDAARAPALIAEAVGEANRLARQAVSPLQEQVTTLRLELAEAERRAEELLSSILSAGVSGSATAKKLLMDAEKRQEQLRVSLAEAEGELLAKSTAQLDLEVVIAALRSFDTAYENLSLEEKREFLKGMIKQVTVHPDRVVVELFEGKQAIKLLEGAKRRREADGEEQKSYRRGTRRSAPGYDAATPGRISTGRDDGGHGRDTATTPPAAESSSSLTTKFVVCDEMELAPPTRPYCTTEPPFLGP